MLTLPFLQSEARGLFSLDYPENLIEFLKVGHTKVGVPPILQPEGISHSNTGPPAIHQSHY